MDGYRLGIRIRRGGATALAISRNVVGASPAEEVSDGVEVPGEQASFDEFPSRKRKW
jgi:hypothetical protein